MNVQPGTRRCTDVEGEDLARSKERCSAIVLTADLEALYAALPGGLVMPCLLPVIIIAFGDELFDSKCGKKVLMPLITPKKLAGLESALNILV